MEVEDVCPGYETQAEGLAGLLLGLDVYLGRMGSATSGRDEITVGATATRDRVLLDAGKALAETESVIDHRVEQSKEEIREKIDSKLEAAQRMQGKADSKARTKQTNRLEKAARVREETVWLADTVHESTQRKAKVERQAIEKQISKMSKSLDGIENRLGEALGPKNAERVSQVPRADAEAPARPGVEGLVGAIVEASDAIDRLSKGGLLKLLRGRKKTLVMGTHARDLNVVAGVYAESLATYTERQFTERMEKALEAHEKETRDAEDTLRGSTEKAVEEAETAIARAVEAYEARLQTLETRRENDLSDVDKWATQQRANTQAKHDGAAESANGKWASVTGDAQSDYSAEHDSARADLLEVNAAAMLGLGVTRERAIASNPVWALMAVAEQPAGVPEVVTLARAQVELQERLDRLDPAVLAELSLPPRLEIPVVLTLPGPRSLLIRHDAPSREQALATMRTVMLRVLAQFPAGKVRFTMADPIGIGQSFAGFMRLSDQEPSPVGLRIWSDPQKIERQLADLTEHMQTVIQKYLRADYETIEDYNHAAGEIAEQYRFVIIADLHEALTDTGAARLKSVLESGPRCGVYAMLTAELGCVLPPNLPMDVIEEHSTCLTIRDGEPGLDDVRFTEAAITLEPEPDDALAAAVLDRVGAAGAAAGRVEVPFGRLVPSADEMWTRSCNDELVIPLGRSGAQRIQELRLGSGTRQHALIAGRTGSGKSTLLHVIVSAATLWHSPDELEIYLIDFKKGVEFKAYTGGRVPHVRAVAIEADREFGLSVLRRLDDELTLRGDLFRKIGAQNLASARASAPDEPLPRVLLLIDEFQEFFTEDDEVASESTLLLDRLVRQGRAFGVHVVLGSQTLAGAYSLARSTLGQIGVRIALQCSEADSYMILGEDNNAARLLERPGEAIYNNAGGLVEGNSPFQTAWLPDDVRDEFLDQMPESESERPAPVVFEGNRPAQLDTSAEAFVLAHPKRKAPRALLGDAVAIAPPTSASLQKRSGANLLILGAQPEPALGMLVSAAISAGSCPGARMIIIDPTPEDDAIYGRISAAMDATGLDARIVSHREADSVVAEISAIVNERGEHGGDPVLLVLGGIHRLRSLRKSDDFSFSLDEEGGASPDKDLVNILREGPAAGVWTLAWCDTLSNLERAMERSTIREFGLRVLMQMSASDSAAMVDSSIASTLGANRAILADDVEGTVQKFRPIDLPDAQAAKRAAAFLRG